MSQRTEGQLAVRTMAAEMLAAWPEPDRGGARLLIAELTVIEALTRRQRHS